MPARKETIIQWNCRGINRKYDELRNIVFIYEPTIICLQETHLRKDDKISFKGYKTYQQNANMQNNRAHGGIAILVRDNIPTKEIPVHTELQAIQLEIKLSRTLHIINIYLPDQTWRKEQLLPILQNPMNNSIVVGDFNCHNPMWGSNHTSTKGKILEEIITESPMILLNNGDPTYLNSGSGSMSCIDLSFATPDIYSELNWNITEDLHHSDHFPIKIEIEIQKHDFQTESKWKLNEANWTGYQADSGNILIPQGDTKTMIESLTNQIIRLAEKHIPKTKIYKTKRDVPWWNKEIQKLNKEKKKYLNRYRKHYQMPDLIEFKKLRAQVKRKKVEAQKKSWITYTSNINVNTPIQKVWKSVQNILGRRKPPQTPILQKDGVIYSKPEDTSNILGEHFQNISSDSSYNSEFKTYKLKQESLPIHLEGGNGEQYNLPITIEEMEHALLQCKDTSPGPDNICYAMIKNLSETAKNKIVHVFNVIFESDEYPNKWKESLIIPIAKPGKTRENPDNYRPIALTSCLGKIFEKIINKRLVEILEIRNLICNYQAGFRKGFSCVDQVVKLETIVSQAFSERKHAHAVFFDLQKAYDTTWRGGILQKIKNWEIKGHLPLIIKSFLENRTFRTKVGNVTSNLFTQTNGIPQGSVLSVTLFAIAINGVADNLPTGVTPLLYVDDLVIIKTGKITEDIDLALQESINIIKHNATMKGLQISKTKTNCMHFCRLRTPHNEPTLSLEVTPIPTKDKVSFLGLTLDRKLKWDEHIKDLSSKLKITLNQLKAITHFQWGADQGSLRKIIIALILSKVDYGAVAYTNTSKSTLKIIDSIYLSAARMMIGGFRTSPKESIYREAGVLPPNLRRERIKFKYAAKIAASTNHPLKLDICTPTVLDSYHWNQTTTIPATYKLHLLLTDSPIWDTLNQPQIENTSSLKKEIKSHADTISWEKWLHEWNNKDQRHSKIHSSLALCKYPPTFTKKDSIVYTRLIIGHTHITHGHLLIGRNPKNCPQCNVTILTVDHIFQCPTLTHHRHAAGLDDTSTPIEILKNPTNYNKVIKYIKSINLYNKI